MKSTAFFVLAILLTCGQSVTSSSLLMAAENEDLTKQLNP
jgi:hypothetical protein